MYRTNHIYHVLQRFLNLCDWINHCKGYLFFSVEFKNLFDLIFIFTRCLFRAWPHPWFFNNLIFAELALVNWKLYFLNSLMFIDNYKMSQELQLFSSDCWCSFRVSHLSPSSIKVKVFLALPPNHSKHDFHLLILSSTGLGPDTQFIWSESVSLHLLGSIAALWHQIDQRVAGLSQLADGHASSLSDELSHRV